VKTKRFVFEAKTCLACPLRERCVKGSAGRTITLHPQEDLVQQARAFQHAEAFREMYSLRVVVEHRIARLIQLGIRKTRYFGRRKTLFQVLMAATVANLTLMANATGGVGAFIFSSIAAASFLTLLLILSEHKKSAKDILAA